jgi:hypothetical protein
MPINAYPLTVMLSEAKHLCIPVSRTNTQILRFAQEDKHKNQR